MTMIGNAQIIIAVGGDDFDGVILKVEQDCEHEHFSDIVLNEWNEHHDLHSCLEIRHSGLPAGVYRAKFNIVDKGGFFVADDLQFYEVSWPDCEEVWHPARDVGPAETEI